MKKMLTQLLTLLIFTMISSQAIFAQEGDNRTDYFLGEINAAKAQVDSYTSPKEKIYLVDEAKLPWLKRAVSKARRDEWTQELTAMTPAQKKSVNDALNALGISAAKKLPLYIPEDKNFAIHNQADENLMKTGVTDIAEGKIFKIGLRTNWLIEKDNFNTPINKYKQGYIWVRYPANDHPYCHLLQVNLIAEYAGGGTYAEPYAKLIYNDYCGCPK